MSFFVTSAGQGDRMGNGRGGNLGGLAGADAFCQQLADAAYGNDPMYTSKVWRAYLSVSVMPDGNGNWVGTPVHARDRIGSGPWFNAKGVKIADNVEQLHSDAANLTKQTILTEKGDTVQGRGDTPNRHDILTGSNPDGTLATGTGDTTCSNWTSNGEGSAMVGHFDRTGGGQNPTSWNSAHASSGCGQANLQKTGGDGLFYCFAAK